MTMLRNLLYAGAAAALAIATPAMASDFDLGTITPGTEASIQSPHPTRGVFTDNIMFDLVQSGPNGAIAYFNFDSRFSNIINATIEIFRGSESVFSDNLVNDYSKTLAFTEGSYTATISGNATGTNGGSYTLGITAPTPEPEVWLSLVAGAGMAGFMARRRRKQAAVA